MKLKTTIDKKAQIGETITWLVATVIIIVILIFSIFIAGFVGKDKEFQILPKKDLLATKSLSGYLLTQDDSGKKVFEQLKDEENLDKVFNNFSGGLAARIFRGLYKKDYPFKIWLGIYTPNEFTKTRVNEYFGGPGIRGVSEEIQLNEDKYLLLTLSKIK